MLAWTEFVRSPVRQTLVARSEAFVTVNWEGRMIVVVCCHGGGRRWTLKSRLSKRIRIKQDLGVTVSEYKIRKENALPGVSSSSSRSEPVGKMDEHPVGAVIIDYHLENTDGRFLGGELGEDCVDGALVLLEKWIEFVIIITGQQSVSLESANRARLT